MAADLDDYTLFHAIVQLASTVDSTFTGYFGSLSEKAQGAYGVYTRGGVPVGPQTAEGKYGLNNVLLSFNVNAVASPTGYQSALAFCRGVIRLLTNTVNYPYTDPATGGFVTLVHTRVMSNPRTLGFNSFNIPALSFDLSIDFTGGI